MNFQTKRISTEDNKPKPNKNGSSLKQHLIPIIGGVALIAVLLFLIVQAFKSLDFSSVLYSFSKPLTEDTKGQTNILLTGVGGAGHDGPSLTDTIMIASIDQKDKLIPMISIPRDIYVATKQTGKSKINSVYALAAEKYGSEQGMYALKDLVSEITGLDIQYYINIDFKGFVKIIDIIGGIDVNVEKDLYDPFFPKGETTAYETFSVKAGPRHFDGTTALKYARSRETTSDFDRAKRQQQIIQAVKEKALSLNILTNPGKIKEIYDAVSSSIKTNLTIEEIIAMAKFSKDINKESTFPVVINNDPTECGGLLYTPSRDYFGGASVLLPAGADYSYTKLFTTKILENIPGLVKQEEVQVLNGTKTTGLAYEAMSNLSRFCVNVIYYSNAEDRDTDSTIIYYNPGPNGEQPLVLKNVQSIIPSKQVISGIPEQYLSNPKRANTQVVVILGKDYLSNRIDDPFKNLKYTGVPSTSKKSSTQQTEQSTTTTSATKDKSTTTKPNQNKTQQ